mmetsp:Transcript_19904/g.32392  ORF Transcript_19904/g.32392 Transcript_19904/m.32392 type:complete len:208 (-) Transcript_19904:199-822(-)|eukprot:jgi/Bigna1/92001/estExt_fgenesh1_pg.C_1600003
MTLGRRRRKERGSEPKQYRAPHWRTVALVLTTCTIIFNFMDLAKSKAVGERPCVEQDLKLQGSCYCGEIKFRVIGKPMVAVNCHCTDCRKAHAAPMYQAAYFPPSSFRIVAGENNLKRFRKGKSDCERHFCKECGTRICTTLLKSDQPGLAGCIGVYPALLDNVKNFPDYILPSLHLNPHDAILDLSKFQDGIPRMNSDGTINPSPK